MFNYRQNEIRHGLANYARMHVVWQCPQCDYWNHLSSTRIDKEHKRVAVDCKHEACKSKPRIEVQYRGHWKVNKHPNPEHIDHGTEAENRRKNTYRFRGDAIRKAAELNAEIDAKKAQEKTLGRDEPEEN